MRLLYLISFRGDSLLVNIEEKGAPRRVLYWDALSILASEEDKEPLLFFRKLLTRFSRGLETLPFQQVEVPSSEAFACMALLAKTGRVVYNRAPHPCDWRIAAQIRWRGREESRFSAYLLYRGEEIALEACEKVFPFWCICSGKAFPIASSVPWKWVEKFLRGPISLEGSEKKRFLEEEPSLEWVESNETPRLQLTDATGCFANLKMPKWESDLLEAGYLKKQVGRSAYFCPGDKVREALLLLLDVGWEIFLPGEKKLYRQTKIEWQVREEEGAVQIRGVASFQEKRTPLRPALEAMQRGRLWVEIDGKSGGLLDPKKGESLEGEWVGEALRIERPSVAQLFPLLDLPEVDWDERLLDTVRGCKQGGGIENVLPHPSFRGTLLPHQQRGLAWLWFLYAQGFSGLLADEMGLGKTVQVLAFFSLLRTNLPVLIVAPASLLYHWRAEISRFLPQAQAHIHMGGEEIVQGEYVIISYARLRIDEEMLSRIEWEVVVLDESNAIKTAATQTAQAARALKGRFRIALSGTPVENRSEEIESQFQFLLPGLIQGKEEGFKKLKPFILRRKKDELDLPEKIEETVWIEMEEEQRKLYDAFASGVQSGLLKKIVEEGAAAHRMEILEAILRLRQICVDPRLIGYPVRGAKQERLLVDLEEALGERRKVLIYSQFTSMLDLIRSELRWPSLTLDGSVSPQERAERVRRFQEDPEILLFLLSLKAGGVGLNLTAADYVFLIDPWWNDAVENQAIDRVHRIGQKKTVIAKRYIVLSTLEEKMLQLKAEKQKLADALFEGQEGISWTAEDWLRLLS